MDISNYIESGILEEFVLGSLSEREAETVYSLAEKYPEIMAEINVLENALGDFAMAKAVVPPADLFGKVMDKINEVPSASDSSADTPKSKGSSSGNWLYAACITGLIGSLCLNIYFSYWLEDTQEKNKAMVTQNELCQDKYEELKTFFRQEQLIAGIAKDPSFKRILIAQTEKGKEILEPENEAIVFWNPTSFEVKVMSAKLPPLDKGYEYKLWIIQEGVTLPIDQGVFAHSPVNLQNANAVAEANAFAVSIEPEGQNCEGPCGDVVLVGAV